MGKDKENTIFVFDNNFKEKDIHKIIALKHNIEEDDEDVV